MADYRSVPWAKIIAAPIRNLRRTLSHRAQPWGAVSGEGRAGSAPLGPLDEDTHVL